jgi:hypothetical protein
MSRDRPGNPGNSGKKKSAFSGFLRRKVQPISAKYSEKISGKIRDFSGKISEIRKIPENSNSGFGKKVRKRFWENSTLVCRRVLKHFKN